MRDTIALCKTVGYPLMEFDGVPYVFPALERLVALVRADERERLLPKEPPSGLLMSMAIRYDHGLGMPGYYDHHAFDRFNGDSHAKRLDGTLSIMRQLYEEVSRHGFYSDACEGEYAAIRARGNT